MAMASCLTRRLWLTSGNLYGATLKGGTSDQGVIFQLPLPRGGNWEEKIIYNFPKSASPQRIADMVMGSDGTLYVHDLPEAQMVAEFYSRFRVATGKPGRVRSCTISASAAVATRRTVRDQLNTSEFPGSHLSSRPSTRWSKGSSPERGIP